MKKKKEKQRMDFMKLNLFLELKVPINSDNQIDTKGMFDGESLGEIIPAVPGYVDYNTGFNIIGNYTRSLLSRLDKNDKDTVPVLGTIYHGEIEWKVRTYHG